MRSSAARGYLYLTFGYVLFVTLWVFGGLAITASIVITLFRYFLFRHTSEAIRITLSTLIGGGVFWGMGFLSILPGSWIASYGAWIVDPDARRGFGPLASKPFVRADGTIETGTRRYISEAGIRRLSGGSDVDG